MSRILIAIACTAVALSLGGCKSGTKTYDISVEVEPEVRRAGTTNVHLIGLNEPGKIALEDDEPSDYWDREPQSRRRAYPSVHEMRFEPGSAPEQTLKRSEPVWTTWRRDKATWIAVFAEGAGAHQMLEFIPLKEDWGGRRLRVVIAPRDITVRADNVAQ